MKKKIVKYLFLLVGCFWMFSSNIYADKCRFYIGNEQIDEDNPQLTDGKGGKVTIDGKTVTFDNFTFEGEGRVVRGDDADFYTALSAVCGGTYKIVLKGKNTIKIDTSNVNEDEAKELVNSGLYFRQALEFEGDGELDIYTDSKKEFLGSVGLFAENGFKVKKATIKSYANKALTTVAGFMSNYGILLEDANIYSYVASSNNEDSESYGIYTPCSLTAVRSNIVVDVKNGNNLRGIYVDGGDAILNLSSLDLNVGKAKHWSFGVTIIDGDILVNEGSFAAYSDGRVLNIDNEASFNKASVWLASEEELSNLDTMEFLNYSDKKVLVGETSDGLNLLDWDYQTGLSDYKYLKIVPTDGTTGKIKSETNNDKFNIISDNLMNVITLTPYELVRLQAGEDISLRLRVSESMDDVSTEDQELINESLGAYEGSKVGAYLDVSLFKKVGNKEEEKLSVLNQNMKLSFELDDELVNKETFVTRTYKVLRVHDGEVTDLETSYDEDINTLTFETDCFSSYALIYSDEVLKPGEYEEPEEEIENPKTVDGIVSYIMIAIASLATLSGTIIYNKKKNNA